MSRWPRDNQDALIAFYGTPGADVERQLVSVVPPFRMTYEGKPIQAIRFHRKASAALQAALKEIWDHYAHDQKQIDTLGISRYAGAYNPRFIRGSSSKWSNHAYGAAIDLNAEDNGFGKGHGTIPQPVIDAFKRQGARWGGDYHGRTDPMHFEFCDNGQPDAQPVKFVDTPPTDADSDAAPDDTSVVSVDATESKKSDQIEKSAAHDVETSGSWLSRKWGSVTGWFSGVGGVGVLGYLSDWHVVVAVGACVLVAAVGIIWFMGPGKVRAWVRKQVS